MRFALVYLLKDELLQLAPSNPRLFGDDSTSIQPLQPKLAKIIQYIHFFLDKIQALLYISIKLVRRKAMNKFLKQLEDEIARLENEKLDVDKKIRALRLAYQVYINDVTDIPETPVKKEGGKEQKVDIMERILREAGKALHYKEIAKRVEKEGYLFTNPKNKIGPVTATLSMSKRFKKTKPGFYKLANQ